MARRSEDQVEKGKAIGAVVLCVFCLAGALVWIVWSGRQKSIPLAVGPVAAPKINSQRIPLDEDTREDRTAALARIPPAPGGNGATATANAPIKTPTVAVPVSIAPILIQGSGSNPLEVALNPSKSPPPGVIPATQPAADASALKPGTFEYAVNLEIARKFVMSMCTDQQGNLWVGTEGGGVQRFNSKAPKYQQWTQFTTKDGLGDDNGYAVACDQQGRIWAGHLNHGVSVFNGEKWQNYEVVAGLSRPDTLSGPLGERVFHITVCPTNGDVWMATSCGLARYSPELDSWSYFTRADGLPSDQANSMAFDADGNIYVATQCDGIAMADAKDDYHTWRQSTGPDDEPAVPMGAGLPTNLINDVLVSGDGTVYAATDVGLAWSKDLGQTWQFMRGKDWTEKTRRRTYRLGPEVANGGAILGEDYCTCILETSSEQLFIGHRQSGSDVADLDVTRVSQTGSVPFANSMAADPAVIGYYGSGVGPGPLGLGVPSATTSAKTTNALRLPSGARPPALDQLASLTQEINALPKASHLPVFLGEDWATRGDWVGRYGRTFSQLCASHSPRDEVVNGSRDYIVKASIGPNADAGDTLRHWLAGLSTDDPRSLWDPICGNRRQGEWNDDGEQYAVAGCGPDIWAAISVPAAIHDISLYFVNDDGHQGVQNARRDFVVELRGDERTDPVLARCRVDDFYGGVYKTFRVLGPGKFQFHIVRNHSLNAICSAVLADKRTGPKIPGEDRNLSFMIGVSYKAAEPDMDVPMPQSADAWNALNLRFGDADVSAMERPVRILSYRGASVEPDVNPDWLTFYRWGLHLWSENDRRIFDQKMAEGWAGYLKANPGYSELIKRGTIIP